MRAILRRGIDCGELRADIDREAAIDPMFGSAIYRLVAGRAPVDDDAADAVADLAISALAC